MVEIGSVNVENRVVVMDDVELPIATVVANVVRLVTPSEVLV